MSPVAQKIRTGLPWTGIAAGWFAALLACCYAPVLQALVAQWNNDEDMGHGFFVPLVAGYLAWQRRESLLTLRPSPSWWGLAVVAYGGLQLYIATVGAELFLARTAFIISVIGVVLFLLGWQHLRALAFPIFLLFFMVPIPAIVYSNITFPLQLLASRAADLALSLMQIPVLRHGNILELPEQTLSVVEACSGIRSLLSLSFLALVYGHFFERRAWIRVVLFVATIPIAIVANAGRVTLTGVLSEYKPELAEGFFHSASGWVIFMVALAILIVFHQVLNRTREFVHARRS
ncbi:MAG TPA: exosortase [Bryobacteraceae bacterium]|nr:exosortase [Bryobacteraceae bacterium]